MVAGGGFAVLPLDPVPEALRAALIHENEKILVVQRGYLLVQHSAGLGVGYLPGLGSNLQNHDAGQLSELPPNESGTGILPVFFLHGRDARATTELHGEGLPGSWL